VDDVSNNGAPKIFHLLAHLEPYTQYAYYVKTYTLSTEKNGAQSPIQYFTTSPGQPDIVQNLRAISNSSSEIVSLYWFFFLHLD
jgi:insulin receptor